MSGSANGARRIAADWIAVDWGTSNLRAWAMGGGGAVLDEARSADGMGGLAQPEYEPALLRAIGPWLDADRRIDVVACGMVGARQGWIEADYAAVPCAPRAEQPFTRPETADPRIEVHILHGLRQDGPADVMRGEETQIAGLIAGYPRFDGVVCLPGTHSKWAHVSAGEVVSFASFMTGEIFGLLATKSVLRHSVGAEGFDADAFGAAVEEALAQPERVSGRLFGLRAEALLHGLAPEVARSRLSGYLVGMELAAARPYWLGREIALIGAEEVTRGYAAALAQVGASAQAHDASEMAFKGLVAAHGDLSGGGRDG